MSRIEIRVPPLGDAAPQAVVARWCGRAGEYVARGEVLAELSTDRADLEVAAQADGWLAAIHAAEGATGVAGDLIALLGTTPGAVAPIAAGGPLSALRRADGAGEHVPGQACRWRAAWRWPPRIRARSKASSAAEYLIAR